MSSQAQTHDDCKSLKKPVFRWYVLKNLYAAMVLNESGNAEEELLAFLHENIFGIHSVGVILRQNNECVQFLSV